MKTFSATAAAFLASMALAPAAVAATDKYFTVIFYADSSCESLIYMFTQDVELSDDTTDCTDMASSTCTATDSGYELTYCGASLTEYMPDAYVVYYTDTACATPEEAWAVLEYGTCSTDYSDDGNYETADCDTSGYLTTRTCTDSTCGDCSDVEWATYPTTCTETYGYSWMAVCGTAGSCYSSTSTATRVAASGTEQVPLSELAEGHRVLALDQHAKPVYAAIKRLPHSAATEAYMEITMHAPHGAAAQSLKATLHHGVMSCHGGALVEARHVKAGDCLHTETGKQTVASVKHVAPKAGDVTYSIELAGGVNTVAIGGIFTRSKYNPAADAAAKTVVDAKAKVSHDKHFSKAIGKLFPSAAAKAQA